MKDKKVWCVRLGPGQSVTGQGGVKVTNEHVNRSARIRIETPIEPTVAAKEGTNPHDKQSK